LQSGSAPAPLGQLTALPDLLAEFEKRFAGGNKGEEKEKKQLGKKGRTCLDPALSLLSRPMLLTTAVNR